MKHDIGLWEEAGVIRENPRMQGCKEGEPANATKKGRIRDSRAPTPVHGGENLGFSPYEVRKNI